MTRRYYRVGPSIWLEPWDDDTRHVAFYLLTCEHRNTEGIFRMPLEYAIADLKWPPKRFKRAFHELQRTGFVAYDQDATVCLITKALVWQAPENPNQVKGAIKVLRELPPTPLFDRFRGLAERYSERLAEALTQAFGERSTEPLAEVLGKSPSPTPSQPLDPPSPPQAGGTPAPLKPAGKRQREVEAWREQFTAWTSENFPGCEANAVEQVVTWVRSRNVDPTPAAVREFASSAPNFAHLLEPAA